MHVSCRCVPTPSSVCNSTPNAYGHYIPLASRNTNRLLKALEEIEMSHDFSEECTNVLISLGCYLTFTPCDPVTGDALPLCTESCNTTNSLIQPCIDAVHSDLADLLMSFDCSNASSYLPTFIFKDFTQCINGTDFSKHTFSMSYLKLIFCPINMQLHEISETTIGTFFNACACSKRIFIFTHTEPSPTLDWLIGTLVVLAILVIALPVCLVLVCWKRHRQRSEKLNGYKPAIALR